MRLPLGDDGEIGPLLRQVTPEMWDELKNPPGWLAFAGEDMTVWLQLSVQDGRTVATGMLIGTAEPLSRDILRSIPVGRLVRIAARHGDDALRAVMPIAEGQALPRLGTAKRPGRRGHPPEMLGTVAEIWRRARRTHPYAPMKETARQLKYSMTQTRRLVRRAEAAGLVDEAEGETTP